MKVQNISRRVVSSFCRTAFVAVFFGIGAVTISVNTASAQSADDGFTIPDFPEMDKAISNVVLYLDDGMSNITKVRVEDFPGDTGEVFDVNNLDIDGFLNANYSGTTPLALTVKAGNNAVPEYGPGEGTLFFVNSSTSTSSLPLANNIPDSQTYSFSVAFSSGDNSWDAFGGSGGGGGDTPVNAAPVPMMGGPITFAIAGLFMAWRRRYALHRAA